MTRQVDQYVAGQRLGATQLNRSVDVLNEAISLVEQLRAERSAEIYSILNTRGRSFIQLEIKGIDNAQSQLICVQPGQAANPAAREYRVDLPSIFTEGTRDIGLASLVTYVYSSINTRTASSPGETDETQVITPPFVVGEWVEVFSFVDGRYSVSSDGRFWGVSS